MDDGRFAPRADAPWRGWEPRQRMASLLARLDALGVGLQLIDLPHQPQGMAPGRGGFGRGWRGRAGEVARLGLRQLLSLRARGQVSPESWVLARTVSGRLELVGPERAFGLSVAYARDVCAVGVAAGRALGVDLEPVSGVPVQDLPMHLLAREEAALVREDPDRFVTVWTLKEALGKERGEGLAGDCAALDAAGYARAEPFDLVARPDGGMACHALLRLDGQPYVLALAVGPARR